MPVRAAYLGVILIWSTTPLASQWSMQSDFLFALTARLSIGAMVAILMVKLMKREVEWHAKAIAGYIIATVVVIEIEIRCYLLELCSSRIAPTY